MSKKILLFTVKNSVYFSANIADFKKIISSLGKISPFEVEIVDVAEHPELAEKYRIDALPTLVIGEKRYIGRPTPQKAIEILESESRKT